MLFDALPIRIRRQQLHGKEHRPQAVGKHRCLLDDRIDPVLFLKVEPDGRHREKRRIQRLQLFAGKVVDPADEADLTDMLSTGSPTCSKPCDVTTLTGMPSIPVSVVIL